MGRDGLDLILCIFGVAWAVTGGQDLILFTFGMGWTGADGANLIWFNFGAGAAIPNFLIYLLFSYFGVDRPTREQGWPYLIF